MPECNTFDKQLIHILCKNRLLIIIQTNARLSTLQLEFQFVFHVIFQTRTKPVLLFIMYGGMSHIEGF